MKQMGGCEFGVVWDVCGAGWCREGIHSDLSPKKPGDPASCTVSYLESPYKIHGAGSPYKKHDPYKLCGVCTFLTEVPHKMHGGHTKCIVATQNTRHFLLESLAEGRPFMTRFLGARFLRTEI